MKTKLTKLTSRKFLLSVISMLSGIALLCGANQETVAVLSGAAMTVIPALVYCIMEGKIDAVSAEQTKIAITEAADALGVDASVQHLIQAAGELITAAAKATKEHP